MSDAIIKPLLVINNSGFYNTKNIILNNNSFECRVSFDFSLFKIGDHTQFVLINPKKVSKKFYEMIFISSVQYAEKNKKYKSCDEVRNVYYD